MFFFLHLLKWSCYFLFVPLIYFITLTYLPVFHNPSLPLRHRFYLVTVCEPMHVLLNSFTSYFIEGVCVAIFIRDINLQLSSCSIFSWIILASQNESGKFTSCLIICKSLRKININSLNKRWNSAVMPSSLEVLFGGRFLLLLNLLISC